MKDNHPLFNRPIDIIKIEERKEQHSKRIINWKDARKEQPTKTDVYLTLQQHRDGKPVVYEIAEYDTEYQSWGFIDPWHKVIYWQELPDKPKELTEQ